LSQPPMAAKDAWLVVQGSSSEFLVAAAVRRLLTLGEDLRERGVEQSPFDEDGGYTAQADAYEHVHLDRASVATALVLAAKRTKSAGLVNEILSKARASGLVFDARMVNSALAAYADAGREYEARELFALMKDGALPEPDLTTYTTVLKISAEKGDIADFQETMKQLEKKGIPFDLYVYNMLLRCLGNAGAPPTVVLGALGRVKLASREDAKFMPDKYTYSFALRALCDQDAEKEAERLFAERSELRDSIGPIPEHDWSALLTMYARNASLGKAQVIWKELERKNQRTCAAVLLLGFRFAVCK